MSGAAIKLTDASVKALKPTRRDVLTYEPGGFGVRVSPSGTKTFVLQARYKGQSRRFAIGPVAEWSVKDARAAAKTLDEQLKNGLDPAAERKKRDAKGLTLSSFWKSYIVRAESALKPLSIRSYRAVFSRYVEPVFGETPIKSITRGDTWDMHEKLLLGQIPVRADGRMTWMKPESRKADQPTSRLRTANKAVQILRLLLSDAEDKGHIAVNTHELRDMKLPIDNERKTFLTDEHIAATFAALDVMRGHKISFMSADFLRTMILTGARASELQALEWKHIDAVRKMAVLPSGKNGDARVIPLAGAWDIISAIPPSSGRVFWGRDPSLPFVKFRDAWRKVRAVAKIGDVKPHDLRHSFASVVLAQGYSLPVIGAMLGHRSVASTKRYSHLAPSAANEIASQAAAAMASTAKGGQATATVQKR